MQMLYFAEYGVARRITRDRDAVRRPLSAYLFFANAARGSFMSENPDKTITEISKLIAQSWQTLTPAMKRPYEMQARNAKLIYLDDKRAAEYAYTGETHGRVHDPESGEHFESILLRARVAMAWPRRLRARLFKICIGMQSQCLPALVTLAIFDASHDTAPLIPMHLKWSVVCAVKHLNVHQRCAD